MPRHPLHVLAVAVALATAVSCNCGNPAAGSDGGEPPDAGGGRDAGGGDAATADSGQPDAGTTDAGTTDAGVADAGAADGGAVDAGGADAGGTDAGVADAGQGLTLFTILLENHDYNEVVGSSDAPYINSLIAQYGLATNYLDCGSHPSLPNYLSIVSGSTQYNSLGFIEYDPTISPFPVSADNLGHQLTAAGIPWRSYQESMGTPCTLASANEFAARHNPFPYFADIQNGANNLCAQTNVDYSQFAADLDGGGYRYMWITPNLLDDGHDPATNPVTGLQQTDAWLATEVPKILNSAAFQNGGVLFITWDEAEGRNGDSADQIPMIIVSPRIKSAGYKSSVAYSHANFLATVEDLFGLPRLGAAAGANNMLEFLK